MAVAGVQTTAFNGVEFAKYVTNVKDSQYGPSFVAHRIPHRRGARQEQTGDLPFRSEYALEFAGLEWANNARAILGAIIQKPRGTLTHYLFGPIRMVLKGPVSGSWDPVARGTHYAVSLTFEEDTLTNELNFSRTPSAMSNEISASVTETNAQMTNYVGAIFERYTRGASSLRLRSQSLLVQSSMTTFTTAASDFAAAALDQFTAGQITPELATRLARLPTLLDAATLALRPMQTLNPYGATSVDAAEVTLRQCRNLEQSIRANLPPPIIWPVPEGMNLTRFVGALYPTRNIDDKFAIFQSILTTNRLLRPDALVGGQLLTIPAP